MQKQIAMFLCCVAGRLWASVYDDVRIWYQFDADLNGNGIAELSEIRNQCVWGTLAEPGRDVTQPSAIYGELGGIPWSSMVVSGSVSRKQWGGKSLSFKHPLRLFSLTNEIVSTNVVNGETVVSTNVSVSVTNRWVFPDAFLVTNVNLSGTATIVTRFRWEGMCVTNADRQCAWLINNNIGYTDVGTNRYALGWLLGVYGQQQMTLYPAVGAVAQSALILQTNRWYDMAVVIRDGDGTNSLNDQVEFYVWDALGNRAYDKRTCNWVTNHLRTPITFGVESYATGYSGGNGNAFKGFKGQVNHLAIWNRALNSNEVYEAFAYPSGLCQVGLKGNGHGEFTAESETPAAWDITDPWWKFSRAVVYTKDHVVVAFLTNRLASLDYAYHARIWQTASNESMTVALIVNQVTNAVKMISGNHDYCWFIPQSQLRNNATNTFRLARLSGAQWATFDGLEIGGSWSVGVENNSNSDCIQENPLFSNYFVTDVFDNDALWKTLNRAVTFGLPKIDLNFYVSEEMTRFYNFVYVTRVVGQGGNATGKYAINYAVNGVNLGTYTEVNGTYIRLPISGEWLRAGRNIITVTYQGPAGCYTQFDFHRILVKEHPKMSLVILR